VQALLEWLGQAYRLALLLFHRRIQGDERDGWTDFGSECVLVCGRHQVFILLLITQRCPTLLWMLRHALQVVS
jgi:hypothetical protein